MSEAQRKNALLQCGQAHRSVRVFKAVFVCGVCVCVCVCFTLALIRHPPPEVYGSHLVTYMLSINTHTHSSSLSISLNLFPATLRTRVRANL